MFLGKNFKFFKFIQRLLRLSRDCFTTKSFSWKLQCVSWLISRLSNLQKTCVFSFIRQMWQVFKTLLFPSLRLSRTPFNLKPFFTQTSSFSSKKSLQNHFKVCFPKIVFIFVLDYADFSLGFWKLGIFKNWVGVLSFCEDFSNFLIGLSPIWCLCICVGPLRHSKLVLRQISPCSCIAHSWNSLLHATCLTKCPSDILVLNWTQLSSNAWLLSWLIMFIMFWSMFVCFTHYVHFVPQCHAMHTLGTPHASHATFSCITCCTHLLQHRHTHA